MKITTLKREINMTNEYKDLSDGMIVEMYQKAIVAYRTSPRIMPANDRLYLLQRERELYKELVRRYGAKQAGHFLSKMNLTNEQ
tara:strand:+ start:117 stop:368 length:252 start_codon:yes stop_codon:yes gene_type:complete